MIGYAPNRPGPVTDLPEERIRPAKRRRATAPFVSPDRLPDCPVCGNPQYRQTVQPIVFVKARGRWQTR